MLKEYKVIFLLIIFFLTPIHSFSQENAVRFVGHKEFNNRKLIRAEIKKCPGQITGDKGCIRTLHLLSEDAPLLTCMKKGEYSLKSDEVIVIYDNLAASILIYNSDLQKNYKVLLDSLLKQEDFQPIDLLSVGEVERKGKNKLYVANNINNLEGLLFKTNIETYNKLFVGRIIVKSAEPDILLIIPYKKEYKLKDKIE